MNAYIIDLQDNDKTKGIIAGGRAANLGELRRIGGIRVPDRH